MLTPKLLDKTVGLERVKQEDYDTVFSHVTCVQ
jgi:hypothetical protein